MTLREILNIDDDAERRRLLIVRGWKTQQAEAKDDSERELCDWMIQIAGRKGNMVVENRDAKGTQ